MIACGRHHHLFIDPDDMVQTYGMNTRGQLSVGGNTSFCTLLHPIKEVSGAAQVSAANHGFHSAILDKHGHIWMFGMNNKSQTGINVEDTQQTVIQSPIEIKNIPTIVAVSCGAKFTIALDDEGYIWGVGDNTYSQLGSEVETRNNQFTRLNTRDIGRVVKICSGYRHVICQSVTGELWSSGENSNGQLGVGHNRNVDGFQKMTYFDDDYQIQCGIYFTVVLDKSGGVWVTGLGRYGQLGLGDMEDVYSLTKIQNVPPMVKIICGGNSTMMIDGNGKLYACGSNNYRQLGFCHNENPLSPKLIPDLPRIVDGCASEWASLMVDEEGRLWATGRSGERQKDSRNTFVLVEGRVNVSEKRFRNTKSASLTVKRAFV